MNKKCRVCLLENADSFPIHEINTFIDTEKTVSEILHLLTDIQVNFLFFKLNIIATINNKIHNSK